MNGLVQSNKRNYHDMWILTKHKFQYCKCICTPRRYSGLSFRELYLSITMYVANYVFSSSCGRFSGLNLSSELASGSFECGVWSQQMWFTGSRTSNYKDLKQRDKVFQAGHQGNMPRCSCSFQWINVSFCISFRMWKYQYELIHHACLKVVCDDTFRWKWNRVRRSSIWTM